MCGRALNVTRDHFSYVLTLPRIRPDFVIGKRDDLKVDVDEVGVSEWMGRRMEKASWRGNLKDKGQTGTLKWARDEL